MMRSVQAKGSDQGAAMIVVLTVMLILTALGATAAMLASQNLSSATLDRRGARAQHLAEAGVAQAVAWIRANGVGTLACSPTCDTAAGQPDWGRGPTTGTNYGHVVTDTSGREYRVWIEAQSLLRPPSTTIGRYVIHSRALDIPTATSGSVKRDVSEDVRVTPFRFPIGVFAHTVAAGGNGGIHYESLFSDSCIQGRSFETFQGTDAYYGVPAGAHSADAIVPKQNGACSPGQSIHNAVACNGSYPYDTDKYGSPLSTGAADSACYNQGTLNGQPWLTSSQESSFANMAATYGFDVNTLGLSNSQLDALRTAAQQQGFYYTDTTAIPAALTTATASTTYPHPVLFYDLKGPAVGAVVDLSNLTGYSRSYPVADNTAGCKASGAVVVVLNGNVKLNSNTVLTASVFAPGPYPNGQVQKANGTGQLIGTLYADNIDMRGTADIYLDSCFLANLPGGLLTATVDNYREIDR
jgi:hypothetical protein